MTLVTTARGSHHTTEFKSGRATAPPDRCPPAWREIE